MDWTEDERLHKRYLDWQEEVNLILAEPLSKESKTVKVKAIGDYINSRPDVDKADLMKIWKSCKIGPN